ncbi:DOPA-like domain-containing protein [Jimgerdemannia flammicorona]|uniref:DOPA-like domain-containing protein n=1 Tax=Jimgerdemannia flammicorona TaxID=994334 RepID=A0A433CX71_9FUNG|nr:DOPA-like domain-containing protein [Jimgerdemannia flammicorona]
MFGTSATAAAAAASATTTTHPLAWPAPTFSYDVHVYFDHTSPKDVESATQLRERIIKEFGHFEDLRVFQMHKKPLGPHPTGMFECDFRDPQIFGHIVPWLQIHHGSHSVLVHPRTGFPLREHTENAIWMGEKQALVMKYLPETDGQQH